MNSSEAFTEGLSRTDSGQLIYEPDGLVLRRFMLDRSDVAIIRGPLGSGTSSACCLRIFNHALEQRVNPFTGKRHSRWFIVRNSYPSLRESAIRTWQFWFPPDLYGPVKGERPPIHEIRIGDVELDVIFMSAEGEKDIHKFRSNDYTGVWFNELEFQSKIIFDEAESRAGRYPPPAIGGTEWAGVIADMNAPNEQHWLPKMTGEVQLDESDGDGAVTKAGLPANWGYFVQPSAVHEIRDRFGKNVVGYSTNPDAENLKWLPKGYYEKKCQGKSKVWIDSRLRNKIVFVSDGDPVLKSFNQDTHIAPEALTPVAGHDVFVGIDFGRNRPAAVCVQEVGNRLLVQYEFRRYGMSASAFAPALRRFLERTYQGFNFRFYGDPKGRDRSQADDRTSYDVFASNGMIVAPAPVKMNAWKTRVGIIEFVLNDGTGGVPRFQLSPENCPTLKAGLCGRYQIKHNAFGDPEPDKDQYSDVVDALGYDLAGLGYGRAMIGLTTREPSAIQAIRTNVRTRLGARKVW